ncbi:terminase small subunit [Aneurinibacillus migulanus]|uniref:terminase small subunit n=1 Tax=Aneurinibacillus migulanus TaxID=47500 RepID=UPI00209DE86F|nr:terminase small subunit [Aneurinibacillus migulanus]MCP1355078.1 terminase small subunit [Aneurinibacillus migulanus]
MSKLTPKQQAFVDIYIETGNATQSYIDAGYKATSRAVAEANARRLLANDSVKEFLQERMSEKDNDRIASQDEILSYLTSIMRGECTEETLKGTGKGAQVIVDIDVSAKDRIKAAELLGKRYAMWTEKQQVEGVVPVTIVDDLND